MKRYINYNIIYFVECKRYQNILEIYINYNDYLKMFHLMIGSLNKMYVYNLKIWIDLCIYHINLLKNKILMDVEEISYHIE